MAILVKHKENGDRFILLGTGFGAYQSSKPNWFFGNLMADQKEGQMAMVCVCNRKGEIGWFYSTDLEVESIDGESIQTAYGE